MRTVAIAVVAVLAGTAPATAAERLPLDAGKLVTLLRSSVAAKDAARTERIIRHLVVLGRRVKPIFKRELARKGSPIVAPILEALSRMEPSVRLLARPLLKAPDKVIRKLAAEALAGADAGLLVSALDRERDADVMYSLIDALGGSAGGDRVLQALVEQLGSNDAEVRVRALEALGQRRDAAALQEIYGALRDPEARVRSAAISAVGSMDLLRSVPVLIDLVPLETDPANVKAIWRTVKSVTNADLGEDPKVWKRWLESGT